MTVAGHAVWALIQFVAQGLLGLGPLGEGQAVTITQIQLPAFEVAALKTNMGGFTGFSFALAALAVLGLPLAIQGAITARFQWKRLLFAALCPLFVATIFVSTSDAARGAAIVGVVTFAACLILGYALDRFPNVTSDHVRIGVILTVLSVLLLSVSVAALAPTTSEPGNSGGSTPSSLASGDVTKNPIFDTSNLGIRLSLISVGLTLWAEHPIFGIGLLNFVMHGPQYGLPVQTAGGTYPIHNVIVSVLVGSGIVGLGAVLLWVGEVSRTVYHGVNRDARKRLTVAAVGCGILGYAAFGMFDHLPLYTTRAFVPFLILLGATVGYVRESSDAREN
jgi:O-antigen ligase